MIQYVCDLCKKVEPNIKVYLLPRMVQKVAQGGKGTVALAIWDNIEDYETHLCPQCRCQIACMFNTVK